MRLRLRIERHTLPPIQAIWPIPDPKATVAQLLQAVNGVFPLEADTWGLEDYSVTLAGFELLHYHELNAVCKDEDDVIIKPLSFREVRTRTLTGRDQITIDGRHLLDGIPFGKPALRGPMRPELRIPPRADHVSEGDSTALILAENDEASDEDDVDYNIDSTSESSSNESTNSSSSDSDSVSVEHGVVRKISGGIEAETASSHSSGSTSSSTTSSSPSESDLEFSVDSDVVTSVKNDKESWDGISSTSSTSSSSDPSLPTSPTNAKASSNRKREQEIETGGTNDLEPGEANGSKELDRPGIPFNGLSKTKARNARRRDTKRLKHLIETGILAQGSTLQDLKEHMEIGHECLRNGNATGTTGLQAVEENIQVTTSDILSKSDTPALLSVIPALDGSSMDEESSAPPTKKPKTRHTSETDLAERRQALLNQIAAGGIDVTNDRIKQRGYQPVEIEIDDGPPDEISSKDIPSCTIIPSTNRTKLDLAHSNRLVFGALGVRVPKTQDEKDRLRHKLAQGSKRSVQKANDAQAAATTASTPVRPPQEDGDPDAWRQKIKLRAVECCEKNVTLSTPPFPFQQRWDPQLKRRKAKSRVDSAYVEQVAPGEKRKRKSTTSAYFETYDKYNLDGNGDALEYDDADDEDDSDHWEDGALLESDFIEDDEFDHDDLPPLPEHIDSLPLLVEDDLQEGDAITFTELACDATTNWEPAMTTRSAMILQLPRGEDSPGDAIPPVYTLRLAKRDFAPVTYDDEGNRLYSKFEMPGDDAETLADGTKKVLWSEMNSVRLLSRPQTV